MLDLSRARLQPYNHQRVAVEALFKWEDVVNDRIWPGCFGLFDEMGLGKTKTVIDTSLLLFQERDIDRVIIIAPAPVRAVWFDPDPGFGEIAKHLWEGIHSRIHEFHARRRMWESTAKSDRMLEWVITNYDFIRSQQRFRDLSRLVTSKTLLVLDESSAVKNHKAEQTKACKALRRDARRVWLLNGTPIANSPFDMYSQGEIMDPRILGCQSFFHFRSRYAVMGGFNMKQVIAWHDLDDMQRRFKPYVLRRLKTDCLDLPPKIPSVPIEVRLTPQTWQVYKDMRDEMVAWLDQQTMAIASQAGVKAMRLAQICAGFVGGVDALPAGMSIDPDDDERPDWIPTVGVMPGDPTVSGKTRELGQEKLRELLPWIDARLREDHAFKLLIWCRFRPELARLVQSLIQEFGVRALIGQIHGGQKRDERAAALRLLHPSSAPREPVILCGTPATGSMGINLSAAHTVVYLSNDYSLKVRLQSEDRVHRPGQSHAVSYFDVIASGPNGQKTIDHQIVKALKNKDNMATWTCEAWRDALMEE